MPMLGDLPTWNLSDLYSSPAGTELAADLKRATEDAEAFAKDYEGKVVGLDGRALGAAVARLRGAAGSDGPHRLLCPLYYAQDQADPEARAVLAERLGETHRHRHEAGVLHSSRSTGSRMPTLPTKLKEPALAKYAPWLRDVRRSGRISLSDEMEKLLHEK